LFEDTLTIVLSLGAAVLYALGTHFIAFGLRHLDAQTGTMVDIGSATLVHWLLSPFFVERHFWLTGAALIFAIIGLFRPILSANLAASGVKHLGPTLCSALSATSPFFAAGFGVFLLGEILTPRIALGTAAIVGALVLLLYRGGGPRSSWPLWALSLPLGAAIIRAAGHAFTKLGLGMLPSPFFAGMVTYSASFVLAVGVARAQRLPFRQVVRSPGFRWFAAAGAVHAVAGFLMNWALAIGEVIVVLPIVSTFPFFTMALGFFAFRNERLSLRAVAAVFLVVGGVLLIALAT